MNNYKTVAEPNEFIILDKYTKIEQHCGGYQTESELEHELIQDLINQGYEYLGDLNTPDRMLSRSILLKIKCR